MAVAANDEFPRGGFISTVTSGQAAITLPAIAGVAHVLDEVIAIVIVINAIAQYNIFANGDTLAQIAASAPAGSASQTELDISPNKTYPLNTALLVEYSSTATAGIVQSLAIKWHDI